MSTPLENLPPWVLETGWVVLAIATHVAFLGAMPHVPTDLGGGDGSELVAVAIVDEPAQEEQEAPVEEEPEPVEALEPAKPQRVKPPPKSHVWSPCTSPVTILRHHTIPRAGDMMVS